MLLLGRHHFCPLLCSSLHECSLGISNFLEEISSLSQSTLFLYFFALIAEEGFLISPCYSSEYCIGMGVSFLFFPLPLASLLFSAICKASLDNHFAFLHFLFLGVVLITASCTMSRTMPIVLQAFCLSDLKPWIYLSFPLYNHKGILKEMGIPDHLTCLRSSL